MQTSVGGMAVVSFRSQGNVDDDEIAWNAMIETLRSQGREIVSDLDPDWVDGDGTEHYRTQPIRPAIRADLPDEEIRRIRDVALRTLGMTATQYAAHVAAQCHRECGTLPGWTLAERWAYDDVASCNFLLGELS